MSEWLKEHARKAKRATEINPPQRVGGILNYYYRSAA